MKTLVAKQRSFFNTNTTKDISFRVSQLKKLKRLLKENEAILNDAIYKDFKKSAFDNYTNELALLHSDIDEAIKNIHKWARKKKVRTNLVNLPAKSYILPEPMGVTLVIGAWNYPYQLSLAPTIAAIATGNTVILKPSEVPENTSKVMANLINKNFDPSFFIVMEGGVPETTELLKQQFDKIFFTGSVPVGKIVYQAAAKNLTPVTLELGGKSPAFIDKDCNLKITVKRLVWGKFLNAGQTCIAPDYVLVHDSIKDEFLKLMVQEIEKEQFSFDNGNYVQIINTKNINRLAALLEPDKIFFGGNYDSQTRKFAPTLMHNITFEDAVMQDEIFGPILPVITYSNLDKAIQDVKMYPKPLSCYIFTSNSKVRDEILKELSFGGGAVNDAVMHIANSHLPFGGVGNSGIGSYHGEAGFRTFSHYKSILEKPTWFEPNLKYYPHTAKKLKIIKWIMGLR